MTLQELFERLEAAAPDLDLTIETDRGPVGPGYHITEFKLARIRGIDCGGRLSAWDEASMQILASGPGATMTVGKLAAILARSLAAVPGLGAADLRVEHTPAGEGLQIFEVDDSAIGETAFRVVLAPTHSQCKPAVDMARAGAPCCGATSV